MRLVAIFTVSLSLLGCTLEKPNEEDKTEAARTVDLLFEHDGVRVYRFSSGTRYHYYAVPRNGTFAYSFSEWSESCGKNCTRVVTDEIPTMGR